MYGGLDHSNIENKYLVDIPEVGDMEFSCSFPDVLAECKAAKAAHPGRASFYLAHPYKCDKYIWCFSNGDNGADVPCSTTLFFNPSYDPDKQEPCSSYTGQCVES